MTGNVIARLRSEHEEIALYVTTYLAGLVTYLGTFAGGEHEALAEEVADKLNPFMADFGYVVPGNWIDRQPSGSGPLYQRLYDEVPELNHFLRTGTARLLIMGTKIPDEQLRADFCDVLDRFMLEGMGLPAQTAETSNTSVADLGAFVLAAANQPLVPAA